MNSEDASLGLDVGGLFGFLTFIGILALLWKIFGSDTFWNTPVYFIIALIPAFLVFIIVFGIYDNKEQRIRESQRQEGFSREVIDHSPPETYDEYNDDGDNGNDHENNPSKSLHRQYDNRWLKNYNRVLFGKRRLKR
jgi:uncharacterized membrane protein YuzA (DUF378 family)